MSNIINATQYLASLFARPSWDWLLVLFLFSAAFLYGLVAGRNKLVLLLLATYPAILISGFLPYPENLVKNFNVFQVLFLKTFVFFILLLFIFWVLNRPGFSRTGVAHRWSQVLFLSILNACLWTSYLLTIFKEFETEFQVSNLILFLFGASFSYVVWLSLPIVYLFFTKELG